MGSVLSKKSLVLPVAALALAAAWLAVAAMPAFASFGIGQYISGGTAAAAALATTIVGYLNSWAGFALAVAAAAAFGLSWTVVVIKGVLQKVGVKFAIEYATML